MKNNISIFILILFLCFSKAVIAQKTEMLILPTIHGGHKTNLNYNFDHLRKIIKNFNPDIVALEIRPEDMDRDSNYLKLFYNPEMIMFRNEFLEIKKIGIDFMGSDFEGKSLPESFMKENIGDFGKFRAINQSLMRDSNIVKARINKGLTTIGKKRSEMMASLNVNQLMDGKYDSLTEEFTIIQSEILKNTPYQFYDDFQIARDQRIVENIKEIALKNKGKRIIVLTGANHHNRAIKELEKAKIVNLLKQIAEL